MTNDYLLACLIMGLGIGIDVAIATALRAHALQQQKMTYLWIIGVTTTHTVFPMAGYLLTYFSIQSLPVITPLVGVLASGLIAWFLYDELFSEDDEANGQQLMVTLGLILAVSWDALWSGPAKSAQVVGWSEILIWISFLLVGLVVMVFAIAAYNLAKQFCKAAQLRGSTLILLQWIQYSVISYFGLLAFIRYTLASEISDSAIFMLAIFVTSILMTLASNRHQTQSA
jgi:hypothetical protein